MFGVRAGFGYVQCESPFCAIAAPKSCGRLMECMFKQLRARAVSKLVRAFKPNPLEGSAGIRMFALCRGRVFCVWKDNLLVVVIVLMMAWCSVV